MRFTDNGGQRRKTSGVRVINVAGCIRIQIIERVVETTYAIAPASAANPVGRLRSRSLKEYRHFESELTIIKVVESAHDTVGPVVVCSFYWFIVRQTQPRPIGRKPLRHK